MKHCEHCAEVNQKIRIHTSYELQRAIRVIRANLADGTIKLDVKLISDIAPTKMLEFSDLSEKGTWPDYIEYYFRCIACDQAFRLAVETYHGSGGTWEPCDPNQKDDLTDTGKHYTK